MKHRLADMKLEMQQEVNEFYRRFNDLVKEHREAHIKERRQFLRQRRKGSNFDSIVPISFKKLTDN